MQKKMLPLLTLLCLSLAWTIGTQPAHFSSDRTHPPISSRLQGDLVYADRNLPIKSQGTHIQGGIPVPSSSGGFTEDFTTTIHMDAANSNVTGWGTGSIMLPKKNFTLLGTYDFPGTGDGLFVDGDYAYVNDGNLRVVNVTDPANPTFVASVAIGGDVFVDGNYAYVSTTSRLYAVNITDPTAPTLLPNYATGGGELYVAGNYAYCANPTSGLRIINITDPTSPTLVSTLPTVDVLADVFVEGHYAYLAEGWYMRIVDITDPVHPTVVASKNSMGNGRSIFVSGKYAYLAGDAWDLLIYDVSNPSNPILKGYYHSSERLDNVWVSGRIAYVSVILGGDPRIEAVNVTNPTSPTLLGIYHLTERCKAFFIAGGYLYLCLSGDFRILAISDLISPTSAGIQDTPGYASDVAVAGNYAYIADSSAMVIFDITDPTSPSIVGSYTASSARDVFVAGHLAYLTDGSVLKLINITDSTSPSLLGQCTTSDTARGVFVAGRYAYTAISGDGLAVVNVTDPTSPTIVATCDTPYSARAVYVAGNYAYIADYRSGLQVVDIADPTHPTIVGSCDTPGGALGVHVAGNYAYIADYDSHLLDVINVTDPTNPTPAGNCSVSQLANRVFVAGDYAYVGDHSFGLKVVNITVPTQPSVVGAYNPSDSDAAFYGIVVSGDYAYIASWLAGLYVVEVQQNRYRQFHALAVAQSDTVATGPNSMYLLRANLTAADSASPGTNITYYLSPDAGTHWEQVTPSQEHYFVSIGHDLQWKATLNTSVAVKTPRITSLAINWVLMDFANFSLWSRTYGWSYGDMGFGLMEHPDGNFSLAGWTELVTDEQGWLIQTNSTGGRIWDNPYGGTLDDRFYDVIECIDGGLAAVGYTYSYGLGGRDVWLVRLEANGTLRWYQTFGSTKEDLGMDLIECNTGGFAIAGYTNSYDPGSTFDAWLLRTDENGTLLWSQLFDLDQISVNDDRAYSIVECSGGGFALGGKTAASGSSDFWLIRTDSSGQPLWNKTYGGVGEDWAYSLIEMRAGGFVLAGYTESFGAGGSDIWMVCTDASGNSLWSRTYGGASTDVGQEVLECDGGGFALVGYTQSSSFGGYDAILVRTDFSGNQLWNRTYGGTADDLGRALVECREGGYALAGQTQSWGNGSWDAWLVRIQAIQWNETPTDQEREPNKSFRYDLNVTAWLGVDTWWVNDTTHFAIDGDGVITNATSLGPPGATYGLWVRVNDTCSDFLSVNFTLTVWEWTPPSWDEVPSDQGIELGTSFRYDLNASDPSGIDQWWINDTTHFTIDSDGVITNATFLAAGGYGLEVSVNDTCANVQTAHFLVDVADTVAPTWDQAMLSEVHELGTSFTKDAQASDLAGIAYYWINDTTHFAIQSNGVIVNASFLPVAVYWLEVRAYDPSNNYCSATFYVQVVDTIDPTWDPLPSDQIHEVGPPFDYQVSATDLGGIHHYWINDTLHFAIDAGGHITNATTLLLGQYGLEVRAYDPSDNYCSATITITVQDTIPPAWNPLPSDQIHEVGPPFDYQVSATDLGGIHHYWINDTLHFAIDAGGHITNATTLLLGIYPLEVRAYDFANQYCSVTITITVQDTTPPTWVTTPTDQFPEFGSGFAYDLDAVDVQGIASYLINDTVHFTIDDHGRITNATFLHLGKYGLKVWAYDPSNNYCSAIITITVQDTTPPTWITTPTDQVLEFDSGFSFDVNATDLRGIAYYWINDTTNFTVDENGRISNRVPLVVNAYGLEIRAYDPSDNYCSATITITVQDTTPPVWDPLPSDQVLLWGEPLDCRFAAMDVSGIDRWVVNDTTHFAISDGHLTSTVTLAVGTYRLLISVYDPYDNGISAAITVTVQSPPPVIPGFPGTAILVGLLIAIIPVVAWRRSQRRH